MSSLYSLSSVIRDRSPNAEEMFASTHARVLDTWRELEQRSPARDRTTLTQSVSSPTSLLSGRLPPVGALLLQALGRPGALCERAEPPSFAIVWHGRRSQRTSLPSGAPSARHQCAARGRSTSPRRSPGSVTAVLALVIVDGRVVDVASGAEVGEVPRDRLRSLERGDVDVAGGTLVKVNMKRAHPEARGRSAALTMDRVPGQPLDEVGHSGNGSSSTLARARSSLHRHRDRAALPLGRGAL